MDFLPTSKRTNFYVPLLTKASYSFCTESFHFGIFMTYFYDLGAKSTVIELVYTLDLLIHALPLVAIE